MGMYNWQVGDRITAARLNTPRDLLKGTAGGDDSVAPNSSASFDFRNVPATSFLLPNGSITSSNLSGAAVTSTNLNLTYLSTVMAANTTLVAATYTTLCDLPLTTGIWLLMGQVCVIHPTISFTAMAEFYSSAHSSAIWGQAEGSFGVSMYGSLQPEARVSITTAVTVGLRVIANDTAQPLASANYMTSAATYFKALKIGSN